MLEERLFACQPTARERVKLRHQNRARQGALFIETVELTPPCPACSGIGEACSCATTGAEALELDLGH